MATEKKITAPFGTWKSDITTELLTAKSVSIEAVDVYEPEAKVYHLEQRPAENGRATIVEHCPDGSSRDVLPAEYSASSGIHEYGGGSFCVSSDGNIIFVDGRTRTVFSLSPSSGEVRPITEEDNELRWADFSVHPTVSKWVLAIKEDHRLDPVENILVVIDASTKENHVIARGADFYKAPRFSLDGTKICWVQWNHPDMPWTGSKLYVADWKDGKIGKPTYVAGKAIVECIDEPTWGPDGSLFFVSDRTGYLQLYRLDNGASEVRQIKLEGLENVEFSGRNPMLGSCTYVIITANTMVAAYTKDATNHTIAIDLPTETWKDLGLPLISIRHSAMARISDTNLAVIGQTALTPTTLYQYNLQTSSLKELKSSMDISPPASWFSEADHISFPRVSGEDKEGICHCFFSPPKNPSFQGPPNIPPPLIVSLHGGPTSHVAPGLSLLTQYWTSRGYAWVDINYTGSSGYGRSYRDALNGKWGVSDTSDSASCVAHLVSCGLVDGSRIGIRGGSAGGYGVLQALCSYPTLWAGGVSEFGVGDLKALAADTHKFESCYIYKLLFDTANGKEGVSEEEMERVYRERSPLFHAERIKAPVLLLQGSADRVVPPNQAWEMEKVIRGKGGDAKVVVFEGEGHGWGRADTVMKAIEEEEAWWKKTLLRV